MDWQQPLALLIVGATAAAFLWSKMRKRFSFEKETHCGCSSPAGLGPRQKIRFSARKGERAQVIIKNQ